jgi:hypothetical protein
MEISRVTLSRLSRVATIASCLAALRRLLVRRKHARRRQGRLPLDVDARTSGLEVPPDLTQLTRESRYQQPSGTDQRLDLPGRRVEPAAWLGRLVPWSRRSRSARFASSGSATSAG